MAGHTYINLGDHVYMGPLTSSDDPGWFGVFFLPVIFVGGAHQFAYLCFMTNGQSLSSLSLMSILLTQLPIFNLLIVIIDFQAVLSEFYAGLS